MCQVGDSVVWHTSDSSVITFGFLALLTSFFHPSRRRRVIFFFSTFFVVVARVDI